jgi:uncharacterized protein (UPF0333 family)
MAFSFVKNISVTSGNGCPAFYSLKTTLVSNGWTVQSSSDGTTYNSSGDAITSANSGANGLNNNNAWFRVRVTTAQDGYNREFVIQRGTSASNWNIKYSLVGFTGGSPNATTTPTATDEQFVITTSTAIFTGTESVYICVGNSTDKNQFYLIGVDPGASPRAVKTIFALDRLLANTYPSAEKDPYIIWINAGGTSVDLLAQNISIGSNENQLFTCGWMGKGTAVEAFKRLMGYTYRDGSGNYLHANNRTGYGANSLDGYITTLPIVFGRNAQYTTPRGAKGASTLFQWHSASTTWGTTFTQVSFRDRIVFGDVNVPWDGSAP